MISFLSLISGSSGNSTFISDGSTNLLIDCGMSGRRLKQSLESINISPENIDGILVTHEHIDHTKGIGVLSRRYDLPIYANTPTLSALNVGPICDKNLVPIEPNKHFNIGTIDFTSFPIPHDAAQPVGYKFFIKDKTYTLATDLGHINDELLDNLKGSDSIILESNHDVEMLRNGTYPFYLKQRILSDTGHLSNDKASDTVVELIKSGTCHIMLGHLSRENNLPEIAKLTTQNRLMQEGIVVGKDITLNVADRYNITRFD